jgi:hypothetical protein
MIKWDPVSATTRTLNLTLRYANSAMLKLGKTVEAKELEPILPLTLKLCSSVLLRCQHVLHQSLNAQGLSQCRQTMRLATET